MQTGEGVAPTGERCSEDCPFCETQKFHGYKTKHGAQKDEKALAKNLASDEEITSEDGVGNVFPQSGGGDKTIGWEARAEVFESFPVKLKATPHHLLPGKAAMKPSRVEKFTREAKGKILEDVGYNIDGPKNGVFLPHLPEIYWTRHKDGKPMSKFYWQTWSGLSYGSKRSIGFVVMTETGRQMHYTDHDDPYIHVDNDTCYDDEAKKECNQVADFFQQRAIIAGCKDAKKKLRPPYVAVTLLNQKSEKLKRQISGSALYWESWVSSLAQELTAELKKLRLRGFPRKFLMTRLTK